MEDRNLDLLTADIEELKELLSEILGQLKENNKAIDEISGYLDDIQDKMGR